MAIKKARILVDTTVDGVTYKCNQVIEADEAVVKELVKAGEADASAQAVKYMLDEVGSDVVKHVSRGMAKAEAIQAEIAALETDLAAAADDAAKADITAKINAKQDELATL
jgi:hypothetical protein